MASELQILCPYLLNAGLTEQPAAFCFYVGAGDPSSSPHACTLLAEPSPQPWHLYFNEGLGMADFLLTPALECLCSWAVYGFFQGH